MSLCLDKLSLGLWAAIAALVIGPVLAGCGSGAEDIPEGQSLRNPGGTPKAGPPVTPPNMKIEGQD